MVMKKAIGIYAFLACFAWSCQPHPAAVQFDSKRKGDLVAFTTSLTRDLPVPALGLVVVKGDSLFYRALGKTSIGLAGNIGFTESTPIFAGSLSQLMVATAVVRLAADGRLAIDDAVVEHLPYFQLGDNDVSGITIRHLMNQTSGVPVHAPLWDHPDFSDDALERTTQSIRFQEPAFTPPGSRVKRSPYNYDILADLVAKVSGMDFEDYMQTAILSPLGMVGSFFPKDGGFKDTVAHPHHIVDGLTYAMDTIGSYPANREHSGSMGLHATTADLALWLYMLVHRGTTAKGDVFLPAKWVDLLFSYFPTDTNAAIGFGWEVSPAAIGQVYEQFHDMGGFSAHVAVIPEKKLAVALISNISGDFDVRPITRKLMNWLAEGGDLPPERPLLAKTLGELFVATRSMDRVFQYYDTLEKDQPSAYDYSLESLAQLGVNLLYRAKDLEAAIVFFEACAERFPHEPAAQLNLAEAYFSGQRMPQCRQALERTKALLSERGGQNEGISTRIAMLEAVQARLSTTNSINNQ